jgi:hypothetical protein
MRMTKMKLNKKNYLHNNRNKKEAIVLIKINLKTWLNLEKREKIVFQLIIITLKELLWD